MKFNKQRESKKVRKLGKLNGYVLSNVELHENSENKRYKFHFLGNNLIVVVQVVHNMLDLLISVPPTFVNQTAGLMGVFNGDPTDDFQTSS